jgi:hypothetical protein
MSRDVAILCSPEKTASQAPAEIFDNVLQSLGEETFEENIVAAGLRADVKASAGSLRRGAIVSAELQRQVRRARWRTCADAMVYSFLGGDFPSLFTVR